MEPRLSARVLTPLELEHYRARRADRAHFLAGRWAAKEALIKAWMRDGGDKVFMQDIVILAGHACRALAGEGRAAGCAGGAGDGAAHGEGAMVQSRAPRAFVRRPDGLGWKEAAVSISHDGEYAMAFALVTAGGHDAHRSSDPSVASPF